LVLTFATESNVEDSKNESIEHLLNYGKAKDALPRINEEIQNGNTSDTMVSFLLPKPIINSI
jgi:hypothetical protein